MIHLLALLLALLAASGLLLSFPSFAEDTGVVAATLKDEASECRYLLKLCVEERRVRPCLKESTEELEHLTQEYEKAIARNITEAKRKRLDERSDAAHLKHSLCMNDLMRTMNDRHNAAKVIRAKHETVPACFQECADMMDPNLYK